MFTHRIIKTCDVFMFRDPKAILIGIKFAKTEFHQRYENRKQRQCVQNMSKPKYAKSVAILVFNQIYMESISSVCFSPGAF